MDSHQRRAERRALVRAWRAEDPEQFEQLLAFLWGKVDRFEFSHVRSDGVMEMRRKRYFTAFGITKSIDEWKRFVPPTNVFVDKTA